MEKEGDGEGLVRGEVESGEGRGTGGEGEVRGEVGSGRVRRHEGRSRKGGVRSE